MNAELDLLSHTALKGTAVLLAALVAGLVLRRLAASRRYAIWMTTMLALAVLPFAMLSLPAWRVIPKNSPPPEWMVLEPKEVIGPIEEPVKAFTSAEPIVPMMPVTAAMPPPEPARPLWTWDEVMERLPMLWLGVAALLMMRLVWSAMRLGRLRESLETGECEEIAAVARELGLKRVPRLFVGAVDAVPMVWGVRNPCLLLPRGFESWSSEKRRGVLLHELAHLRRRDPLALWLAQTVKALHWFNPLAWLTLRQMRADQERACDDAVLRHGVRASDYAQALLDLSRHNRVAPGLALCALTITRCAPVESRVRAVLDVKCSRDALTLRWLAGMTALAMLLMLPVAMLHAIEGPKLRGRILDRHGVVLAETTKEKSRHYPLKALAAHVIGYTGKTKHDDPTPMGWTEIEKSQNELLTRGEDVKLTLDARIQSLTHRALLDAGYERGAAVILDPRSGEILAMVSLPVHDPNVFIPSISQANWEKLAADLDNPLMNRCVRGFTPGSAFMPLTGLAGIAAGIGEQSFTCEGSVRYGSAEMQCWIQRQNGGKHGSLKMPQALVNTCSCFWYQFGNAAGIEKIEKLGARVGFGTRYGISENESSGILPGPQWMKENQPSNKWSQGYTANTSIGQGMMLATPLQMAVLAATLANGGKVPQPAWLNKEGKNSWRADLIDEGLPAAQIEKLREGMRHVVQSESGTGKAARSEKVVIAGKTGTAQNWRPIEGKNVEDNHAWFIGFAPYDRPTLAFAILKQGAKSGGGDCAPVAKRIVEEALALPADGSGEVKAVETFEGRLNALRKASWERFDKRKAEFARQIKAAQAACGQDLVLQSLRVWGGRLSIRGEASGMIQALDFRKRILEAARAWQVEWSIPVPETLSDGQRVRFTMEAEDASPDAKPISKNIRLRTKSADAAIHPTPTLLKNWQTLQRRAGLADLPATAVLQEVAERDKPGGQHGGFVSFTAAKDAVRTWLKASLSPQLIEMGDKTSVLVGTRRLYPAPSQCMLRVEAAEGGRERVIAYWNNRILIAK